MNVERKPPIGFATIKELADYFKVGRDYMTSLIKREFPDHEARTKVSPQQVQVLLQKYDAK